MVWEINASTVAGLPRMTEKSGVSDKEHRALCAGSIPLETPLAVLLPLVYLPGSP